MTLDQFIEKYKGKKVEYHSYSSNSLYQCADPANQYIVEVLGLPAIIGTNAQDFPKKCGDKYDYILNTPTGIPKKGDIMIWKSADNIGHIAIFVSGDEFTFTSFDQNWPTGSPCSLIKHNYTNVLGWLRAVQITQGNNMQNDLQSVLDYYNVKTKDELIKMVDEQIKFLSDERNKNAKLQDQNVKLVAQLDDYAKQILHLKGEVKRLSEAQTPTVEIEDSYVEASEILKSMQPNGARKTTGSDGSQEIEISYKLIDT